MVAAVSVQEVHHGVAGFVALVEIGIGKHDYRRDIFIHGVAVGKYRLDEVVRPAVFPPGALDCGVFSGVRLFRIYRNARQRKRSQQDRRRQFF